MEYEHERAHDPFSPHVIVREESPAGPDPSGPGGDEPTTEGTEATGGEQVEEHVSPTRRRSRRAKKDPVRREDPKLAEELAELEPPRTVDDDE